MRGTLHLLTADDLPLYVAAMQNNPVRYKQPAWLKYHGLSLSEAVSMIDSIPKALDGRLLTREQLAVEVAHLTNLPHLQEKLMGGFGDSQGKLVTFGRPDQWLSSWQVLDKDASIELVLEHYLTAYGSAPPKILHAGGGQLGKTVKGWFQRVAEKTEQVEVEGWKGWMLKADTAQMKLLNKST